MEIVDNRKRIRLDRIQSIFKMQELGKTNRQIARLCLCSASTVSTTPSRYSHPDSAIWVAMTCYEKAKYVWDKQKAAARGKKRFRGQICDVDKRLYVEQGLIDKGWSPEIIASKLQEEKGKKIAINTIYRYVKSNGRRLKQYLYERGKPRRQRVTHRRGRFKNKERIDKKYIDQRPGIINSREEFGHWEGDLVLGPKSGSGFALLSLIERETRYKAFIRMPNAEAGTTLAHLHAFFMQLPEYARKSITLDNGSEFSVFFMRKLEKALNNFTVYYTETYSPQQKGSDEHSNGRLRRTYPKGTDFACVSKSELKLAVQKLNDRPMKLHGYKTPLEMFNFELRAGIQQPLAA